MYGPAISQSGDEFESEASAHLRPDALSVTRGLVLAREFATRAALAPEAADRLTLIVEEWLNNVIEHSGAPLRTRIVLHFERRPGLVVLSVSDAGQPFDPRTAGFSGPNLSRGGGAGLAMIKAWCRIASYAREGGRNRVRFELPV